RSARRTAPARPPHPGARPPRVGAPAERARHRDRPPHPLDALPPRPGGQPHRSLSLPGRDLIPPMALWIQGNGAAGRESLLVRRLIDQGIRDARVLAAFARVPGSFFVSEEGGDEGEVVRPLEIGCGMAISHPYVGAAKI